MAIERKNSFHLLLSNDELTLLRLLAEREGLNASDYLRSLLRQMAGAPPHMAHMIRLGATLGGRLELAESHAALTQLATKTVRKPKTKSKKAK